MPTIWPAVKTARRQLLQSGLADMESIKGCTEAEVESLEQRFSLRLPRCYRDFLAVMGREAGAFLVGTDYSFPKMLEFRKGAEGLLQASRSEYRLAPHAFVFEFHQGYTFLFFDCDDENDDPPVYLFTEGEAGPREVADSFSVWLLAAVDDDIDAYRALNRL